MNIQKTIRSYNLRTSAHEDLTNVKPVYIMNLQPLH